MNKKRRKPTYVLTLCFTSASFGFLSSLFGVLKEAGVHGFEGMKDRENTEETFTICGLCEPNFFTVLSAIMGIQGTPTSYTYAHSLSIDDGHQVVILVGEEITWEVFGKVGCRLSPDSLRKQLQKPTPAEALRGAGV